MEAMTAEEISLILESDLTLEEKSSILASYWPKDNKFPTSSPIKLQEKIEDTKPNTKKVKDDGRKPKSESNIVKESNANPNPNAEKKGLADPLTDEEISSILGSQLTSEEKSSLLTESNLIKKETKACSTPSTVKLKAKEKAPFDLKSTSDEKQSSISSGVKLKGKNQHKETEAKPEHDPVLRHANGSPKRISKGSSLLSQQAPAEDHLCLLELKEHTLVVAKEINGPQTNPGGGDSETIYKEEAICKKCCEPMFDINNVLIAENVQKAKCNCKLSLIHDNCARKWAEEKGSKCPFCGEQIKYVDVTLTVDASNSSPQRTKKENVQRPTYVSKRSSWCCFYIDDA